MKKGKLLALAISTFGIAVSGVSLYIGALNKEGYPAPITVDGEVINFTWTDDNEGENLHIYTDKRTYTDGLSHATVYVAVVNTTDADQDIELQGYFADTKRKISDVQVLTTVSQSEPITEIECNTFTSITDRLGSTSEPYESCETKVAGEHIATSSKWVELGTKKKTTLDSSKEILALASSKAVRKAVDGYKTDRKSVSYTVPAQSVIYYRLNVEYPANDSSNFFLEAISTTGAYGHLDPWFDASWDYRVAITIDDAQVPSTQTSFPVYVDLSDLPADFHTNVKSDGCDIRVVESDETTETPFELVNYDSASDSGELHFLADSVTGSGGGDTTFYIYYGNSSASCYSASDTYGRNAVWSSYSLVYHLFDNTTSGVIDSTSNGNSGSKKAANEPVVTSSGQIGDAQDFDGANDYITASNNINLSQITVQAWAYSDTNVSERHIVSKRNTSANGVVGIDTDGSNARFYIREGGSFRIASKAFSTSQWNMYHGTYNGSTVSLYVNAGTPATASYSGSISNLTQLYNIGRRGDNTSFFNGRIDEVRIRSGALSSNWITAEYNNQSSPSTFYSVGAQEANGGGGTPPRRIILTE